MSRQLDQAEVSRQLADLSGWFPDSSSITRVFTFPDFQAAIRAVDQVAIEAEAMNHHPDMDIRWRSVRFTLATHSEGGVTQLDIELAHRIHTIAQQLGGA